MHPGTDGKTTLTGEQVEHLIANLKTLNEKKRAFRTQAEKATRNSADEQPSR